MQAQGLLTEIRIGARMAHCRVRSQGRCESPKPHRFASDVDHSMMRRTNNRATGRTPLRVVWFLAVLVVGVATRAFAQAEDPTVTETAPTPADEVAEPVGPGASDEVAPPAGVEMMKVKGRAVSGIESAVPESVTQFDAATIDALGAANISDLAKVTPNVEIRSAGATTATFFIRGVGLSDFSSNAAGAVGIFHDDVQLNAPAIQNVLLYDMANVDVKRGPQGYGLFRNASAGAIRIYSQKPTGEYDARIRTSLGSFVTDDARDAFRMDTEGHLNVPLVENVLAARLSFKVSQQDPFIRNGCAGAPSFGDRVQFKAANPGANFDEASICGETPVDAQVSTIPIGLDKFLGDKHEWSARGQLRLSPPGSRADILLKVHGSRLDMDSTVGEFIGTTLVPDPDDPDAQISRFGAEALASNYQPAEQREEYVEIAERSGFTIEQIDGAALLPGLDSIESKAIKQQIMRESFEILGKNLAEDRVLDREPYRGDYSKAGRTTRDTVGGFLRGEFPIGNSMDAKLTVGTEHYERFRDTDTDFSPATQFESVTTDKAKQYTFDAEVTGDSFDGALRWTLGSAMLYERLENESYVDLGLQDAAVRRRFVQNTSSFVTSLEFAWDFLEDFTLEVGGRWNYESKDFRIQERLFLQFGEIDRQRQKTWQEPTGGVSLTYFLTDDISIYSKYTRGFKAGHFNSNNGQELFDPGPASPESIDAFEWGFGSGFFDGRVQARGSFFFYKYLDYQVFVFRDNPNENPSLVIRNAQEVQQMGAEVDLTIEPLKEWVDEEFDGLMFQVRFGWLDSEFLQFTNTVFRQDPSTLRQYSLSIDYRGNSLINSPEFKVSGTVAWELDFEEWGVLTPRYDFDWSDDIFFDATEGRGSFDRSGKPIQPEYAIGQPARILHNVSLAYRTPVGNVEVRGWVRNILDTRYKTFAFDATFFAGQVLNFVGEPRSAGADVTITW